MDQNYMKQDQFEESVVEIKRVTKKTRGGNRMGFTALSVVGDRNGNVGTALSRAPSVVEAIRKANKRAKKYFIEVPIVGEARTIPHEIEIKNGACHLLLKPAPAGTGIRAGGPVRAVLQAAGVQNVVAKILGTNSKKANVDTTIMALSQLKDPSQRLVMKKGAK